MRTDTQDGAVSPLYLLRIEVDGHFHGSSDVPKPWVARIDGMCEKYGLRRSFVEKMNDWRDARKAWSGNTYGVVATFPLRGGHVYEVSRTRGDSSKRHVAREFVRIDDAGKRHKITADDALAHAERYEGPAALLRMDEPEPQTRSWVAEVARLGMPRVVGWVVVDGARRYRLRPGRLYEVHGTTHPRTHRLVMVGDDCELTNTTEQEAMEWLRSLQRS
jgi:hypothetical protein